MTSETPKAPTEDGDDTTNSSTSSEEEDLDYMISCLSPHELEIAARSSYHYLSNGGTEDPQKYARQMAQRYLQSKKEPDRALECMKSTLEFRQEWNLDRLRTIFNDDKNDNKDNDEQQQPSAKDHTAAADDDNETDKEEDDSDEQYRSQLTSRLSSKKNFVMGYDKQGRATFHFIPRLSQEHDLKWTLLESLYTMERAIACTERRSQAKGTNTNADNNITTTKINAMVDCNGFDLWTGHHAPPLSVGQQFLQTLRQHYVGQFYRIFILDAPRGFAWLWKILSPFVGTHTREKIVFLSGAEEKAERLAEYYETDQAAPWMMEGGTKERTLDLEEYLHQTPFDHAFDE